MWLQLTKDYIYDNHISVCVEAIGNSIAAITPTNKLVDINKDTILQIEGMQ